MVSDEQVRRLRKFMQKDGVLWKASSKAGMDVKTARKYLDSDTLPSQMRKDHNWRTRKDPFEGVWGEIEVMLRDDTGFEVKTLFEYLQRRFPGRFQDGQLRTLQRRVKVWRALEGPGKEVFFPQKHHPGELAQSDFTRMGSLEVTIEDQPFDHMVFHLVLTYSNWETGTVCFGENYESLSAGIQNALWELGAVPKAHQTDQLSAAVQRLDDDEKREFTGRYKGLMGHYGLQARKTQPRSPNENGDIEQRHHRFKRAVDQSLRLRGSRDFASRSEYELFLKKLIAQLNAGRRTRFQEELSVMRPLPPRRLEDATRENVPVSSGSTIRVKKNVYSVHSRLIGEKVEARIKMDEIEVWYAGRRVDRFPRLRGQRNHRIDYRHVIDWLVRKPGAFENYLYRSDLFPTSRFRMVFDELKNHSPVRANKHYLQILYLAATEGESRVDDALRFLIESEKPVSVDEVKTLLESGRRIPPPTEIDIDEVNLTLYDDFLPEWEVEVEVGAEILEVSV